MDDLIFFLVATGLIFISLGLGFMLGSMGFIFDIMKKEKEIETFAKKMSSKL